MSSRRLRLYIRGIVLSTLALAGPALGDGTQTGVITGTVLDDVGTPVQGVTVNLNGPQLDRRAVTDDEGRFRFPALGVGGYRVMAELLGLESPPSEVTVYVNKTSELMLRLRQGTDEAAALPEVEDWIQAVAEAPVIDRFETRVGANVSFDFLEDLPVRRFYQSVALLLPAVAGGEDGNPNTSGALRDANLFLVDGVDTTDPTTGLFGLNLAYEAVEEVEVTTAAAGVEYGRATGAIVNVVTRSGSQQFRGLARWVAVNNDWKDDYDYSGVEVEHLDLELAAANMGPDELDSTTAISLGGPVASDRLFFFASWENAGRSFLRPTAFGELWDQNAELESGAFKLTAQPSPAHTVVAQHTFDSAHLTTFAPFDVQPAENSVPAELRDDLADPSLATRPGEIFALEDRSQGGRFTTLQWSAVVGQNLSFALNLAEQERELDRAARNSRGLTADAPHIALVPFQRPDGAQEESLFFLNGATAEGFELRPREQANLVVDWFRGGAVDHEIAFGVDYQQTDSETLFNVPGQPGVDRVSGQPVAGQIFLDFDPDCDPGADCNVFNPDAGTFAPFLLFNSWRRPPRETGEETLAFYVSDTISLRRWLFRFGVRFESVEGGDGFRLDGEGRRGAGGTIVDDVDLAPRVAVTFDPRADGEVLLHAAWGRYHEPFLQKYLDSFGAPEAFSGFTQYVWADFEPVCANADPAVVDHPCWVFSGLVPDPDLLPDVQRFVPLQGLPPNPDLERAAVDELVLGFERQLSARAGLSLHYVDRKWSRLWDDVIALEEDGGVTFEIARLAEARRSYRALQLLFQRRYAERWQLLASYTWSEAEGNFFDNDGLGDFGDFTGFTDATSINRFGPAPHDRPQQLRLFGTYLFPFERLGLSLAAALRYADGVPFQLEVIERVDVFGSPVELVRFATPRGSERLSGTFQLDTAVNFDLRLSRDVDFEIKAEIFNLTGEKEQLGVESLADTGIFGRPRTLGDLQAPRSYRLTLGLRF